MVNADDFGLTSAINSSIAESFEQGWISNASIVANGAAFDEACELAHKIGVQNSIGLHFNIVDDPALSERVKKCPRFFDGTVLKFSSRDVKPLTRTESEALAEELTAQWEACRKRGIEPTHLDSHGEAHLAWGILSVVLRKARDLKIPYVRRSANYPRRKNKLKQLYYSTINARISLAGLTATKFCFHSHEAERFLTAGFYPAEIAVHPYRVDGMVRDSKKGPPMAERFRQFGPVRLESYRTLLRAL